jgi:Domain of unknown function (DUF4440)
MAGQPSHRRTVIKRTMLVLAGAALALLLTAGAVTASRGTAHGPSEANHLRAIERARLHALVVADTTTARRLMANDFQGINPGGGELTLDDYLGSVQSGDIDYLVFEPVSPIAVRLAGDSASLRFEVDFDLVVGGTRLTHQAWITELYERRHGHWQIVWEQATAIPNDFGLFVQSLLPPG